jgi:isopentenyldiphosphate isomerase
LQESEVSEVRFLQKEELVRIVKERDAAFVPHNDEYLRLYDFLCGTQAALLPGAKS